MTTDTIDREATDVALVHVPEGQDAYALFTAKNTAEADRVLKLVRAKIDAFKADMPSVETASGRKEIASFAFKIAKSKTAIEEVGAALAKEAKEIPKRIDANRKHIKDTLDAWRDEVRQPVTDWEKAEEERIDRIKDNLAELTGTIDDQMWMTRSSEILRERIDDIERDFADVSEGRFGEYASAAAELKTKAIEVLRERIAVADKREAEAAELARLRAEAEERAKRDREEQIAREAAEKAKQEAEAKAKADAEAAEQRERDLKLAVERAAEEKRQAEERAAKAEQDARETAAREAQEAREREEAEQRRRESDKAHKARVNRDALNALVAGGISEDIAKTVIKLIATGKVPNVSIRY